MNANVVDVRNTLSEYLNRAQYQGERIVIERRGKPVAALVPLSDVELLEQLENKARVFSMPHVSNVSRMFHADLADARRTWTHAAQCPALRATGTENAVPMGPKYGTTWAAKRCEKWRIVATSS